ncbi:uncharacterized protein EI97DRAFT_437779 [Westerdykella ornata]|uniref:Tyrosine specific protein phosphatases domain-containing protein n=1 Tax=Westerdykella ornata TaxID=318751 RepID=A0A6A6J8J1_WESOR|nr:uncharacterized protein EI97DRAFT_437779 [Westerdykella ornata]KAF2271529.1 hypothetical protein EI97DRAFT_437779 [Westerdykella ornata]
MPTPTLPQPPFFTIPNINNLRDAALLPGGLPIKNTNNKKVRPGLLFRSAEPSQLPPSGWHTLSSLGIARVFDLRSKPEVEKGWKGTRTGKPGGGCDSEQHANGDVDVDVRPRWIQDLEAAGLKRHWVPVFEESDYSPARLAERYVKYMDESVDGFVQAYADILRHAGPAFGEILRYLAQVPAAAGEQRDGEGPSGEQPERLGALVHCTAGKDRTGIFFGVLFAFLGVEDEAIAAEYNLTETGLGHMRDEIVERLSKAPGFREYMIKNHGEGLSEEEIAEFGRKAAFRMSGARKESMLGSLELLRREYGGAEGYLRKVVGLTDRELERLRRALVVDAD